LKKKKKAKEVPLHFGQKKNWNQKRIMINPLIIMSLILLLTLC